MVILCPPHLDRTYTRFSYSHPRDISSCVARQKRSCHARAYQEQPLPLGIRACECVKVDFTDHPKFPVSTISTPPARPNVTVFVSLLGAPPRDSLFVPRCLSAGLPCQSWLQLVANRTYFHWADGWHVGRTIDESHMASKLHLPGFSIKKSCK